MFPQICSIPSSKIGMVTLFLWMCLVLGNIESIRSEDKIPLTKCCSNQDFYRMWFDICREWETAVPLTALPPVHSVSQNKTIMSSRIHADDFLLTHNLAQCPEGYISTSSKEFHFYDDGTLKVAQGVYQPGEFCLNPILELGNAAGLEWVARFCVPDTNPCLAGGHCIRKCCPSGMAFNATGTFCQPHPLAFNIADIVPTESGISVRDGVGPRCLDEGRVPIESHEFHILSDGRLFDASLYFVYVNDQQRIIDEYCIEHFLLDGEMIMAALRCSALPPEAEEVVVIHPYFMILSSFFLIATFVVYALVPELRSIHGVSLMCYVASMAAMYIGLGTIMLASFIPNNGLCVALAIVTHFAFLATFTWMNIISFDIWWTFSPANPVKQESVTFWMKTVVRKNPEEICPQTLDSVEDSDANGARPRPQKSNRTFFYYSLYGWGVPFIIVSIGQLLDNMANLPESIIKPHFGRENKCWFHVHESYLAYLYGPMAIFLLGNFVFFIMTAILICRSDNSGSRYPSKQKFLTIFTLFILMGLTWITELISYFAGGSHHIWITTDLLNILTGVFIFFMFVCRADVWILLKQKYSWLNRISLTRNNDEKNSGQNCSSAPGQTTI